MFLSHSPQSAFQHSFSPLMTYETAARTLRTILRAIAEILMVYFMTVALYATEFGVIAFSAYKLTWIPVTS